MEGQTPPPATSVTDVGLEIQLEDIQVYIQQVANLLRIEANCICRNDQSMQLDGETFRYNTGDRFRLFFLIDTAALLADLLNRFGMRITQQWVTASKEEGIFLARKL